MLKSLELFGFKSFADRTVFEFAPGVTCVVGPNGSGKSNVVDALKWILGDQSAKSLRGKEMSDVIFNGSAGRKPSQFAEATLSFDNSAGLLPIETAEVQVGRRLYVSGESEYLLNRNAVRLKDIRELFMGTGAGTAAYSIIEQGRVDQILQANPTTRRLVFEEAAGISRFKARKVESQRRLERVEQNLLRLRDIVDQVETRLHATRSQASKAAKYREYSTEYRRLWTGLAADDFRAAQAQIDEIQLQLEERQARIERVDDNLSRQELVAGQLDAESAQLDEQIRSVERRRASDREAIAGHEAAAKHYSTQSRELEAETDRVRRQRNSLQRELHGVQEDFADTAHRLRTIEREFAAQQQSVELREQRIEEMEQRLDQARQAIERLREERDQLEQERVGGEQKLSSLKLRLESLSANRSQAEERAAELATQIQAAEEEADRCAVELSDAEGAVSDAQAKLEHTRQVRRRLQSEHLESERQLSLWREERSARTARRQLLEDLEKRQEGMTLGVRELLSLAASSRQRPWNLIRGTVGDLLEAELDDAPLLEVALGPQLQLIVIDELAPMIDYLSTAVADVSGRVGFLDLSAGPVGDQPPGADLPGLPGVMSRADRLVSCSAIAGLAERLLEATWIVESLDVAYRLAGREGRGCRFVTLQGELIEADGTLYVGNSPNELSVISRRSELRLLRNQIRTLIQRIESAEARLAELDASLADQDSELAELQEASHQRMADLADRRSAHASQLAECKRLHEAHQAVATEITRITGGQQKLEQELDTIQARQESREEQVAELSQTLSAAEELAGSIRIQLTEQQQAAKAEQLDLAKHEERLSALQANHLRLLEERRQRQLQVTQCNAHLQASRRKQWETTEAILRSRAALAELYLSDERFHREARGLHQQRMSLKTRRSGLQREQDQLRNSRHNLTDEIHAFEMRLRDLRHSVHGLTGRIAEEFEVDLEEVARSGCSAYRDWLSESSAAGGPGAVPSDADIPPHDEVAEADDPEGSRASNLAEAVEVPAYEEVRPRIEERVERLRRKIRNLGSVNAESLNDLDELEERFAILSGQLSDLEEAKSVLESIIRRINAESRRLFLETFESIRSHFQELYRKLFGGGEGDIVLEDPDDVLECGIDIVARPPGKELRSISLLSGGEKTMTAVALLFAMFKSKPSPYCILDEVDAALDEANVDRYVSVVREFRESTQFVIITHRKRTMTAADRLYGVTMEQAGVSKRLNVEFEDVSDDGNFRVSAAAA